MTQTTSRRSLKPVRRPAGAATRGVAPEAPAVPESRERLVAAAAHFFLMGSYHGVGIAEICAAANVQKGTFYHFFPSKTDLLLEVVERRVQFVEDLIASIASTNVPAARKIIQIFTMSNATGGEGSRDQVPPGFFLANLVLELASTNPPVQAAAKNAFKRWNGAIARIVSDLISEEELSSLDPTDAADAILGLLQGGAIMASAYADPRKMRAFGHSALSLLRAAGASP